MYSAGARPATGEKRVPHNATHEKKKTAHLCDCMKRPEQLNADELVELTQQGGGDDRLACTAGKCGMAQNVVIAEEGRVTSWTTAYLIRNQGQQMFRLAAILDCEESQQSSASLSRHTRETRHRSPRGPAAPRGTPAC